VRDKPSLEGKVIALLISGERVIVEGVPAEGWAQIRTAEFSGYISTEFIVAD